MFEFKVEGMTCGGCVNAVKRAIQNLDPQAEANVDIDAQIVTVKSQKAENDLAASIEHAGFPVLTSRSIH